MGLCRASSKRGARLSASAPRPGRTGAKGEVRGRRPDLDQQRPPLRAASAAARAAEGVDFRDAERRPPKRRVTARRILGADSGDAGVTAAGGTLCRAGSANVVTLAGRLGGGGSLRVSLRADRRCGGGAGRAGGELCSDGGRGADRELRASGGSAVGGWLPQPGGRNRPPARGRRPGRRARSPQPGCRGTRRSVKRRSSVRCPGAGRHRSSYCTCRASPACRCTSSRCA